MRMAVGTSIRSFVDVGAVVCPLPKLDEFISTPVWRSRLIGGFLVINATTRGEFVLETSSFWVIGWLVVNGIPIYARKVCPDNLQEFMGLDAAFVGIVIEPTLKRFSLVITDPPAASEKERE